MPALRLSVALCTFNGSAHLSEQLASLSRQTRRPDELVVFDDGSTDGTNGILKRFAADADFSVKFELNGLTVGPARNFAQAIQSCQGDVIVLCDQDDIWVENKLAVIEAAFQRRPELGFAFGDANVCDESGKPLGYRLWDSVRFSSRLRRQMKNGHGFEVLLRQNVVTGATMAFASRFRPMLLPIGRGWMHDGWIALLLSAISPIAQIDQPIIQYRQHARQAVGALQRSLYQEYRAARAMDRHIFTQQAEMFEAALQRLSAINAPANAIDLVKRKILHCRKRSAIRLGELPRLSAVGEFLTLRYRHFSLGWKSFAQDLFM